jgi:homoserine kinase type II
VSDIARASVYLTTLFRNWHPTPPHVRQTFLDGYQSVRSLTTLQHDWLQALILWLGIKAIPTGHDPAGWANAL